MEWTDQELNRLRNLRDLGMSNREIGKVLHRSRDAVQQRFAKLNRTKFQMNAVTSHIPPISK